MYEAPHRLLGLLTDIASTLGEREICVARELTKLFEETWRGVTSEAIAHYRQGQIRGEITLVVAGASSDQVQWTEPEVLDELKDQLASGTTSRAAVSNVVDLSGWKRRDVYRLALQLKKNANKS